VRVRFCGALLLELVLALVLRCCRARHTLNCVVDPCVGSGAQRRRPNCAGHAVRAARVPLEVVCGAGCAMQLWAVGVRGRAGTPPVRPLRRSACRAAVYRLARHELAPPLCVCVCVRHTAQRRLWGVQLVRRLGLGARRDAPQAAVSAGCTAPCVRVRSPG
jgi:hypothetical protein